MIDKPYVSVIMSTYNENEKDLRSSIESVLSQTYSEFEFLIVNDNPSNQALKNILEEYSYLDSRVRILENVSNIGLTESLNRAIKLAKGELIARMDADDISSESRIEKQVNYLNTHEHIALVGTNCYFINEAGEKLWEGEHLIDNAAKIPELLKNVNFFRHPTLVFRKKAIEAIGYYRDIKYAEDYDLLCRLISGGYMITNIDEKLLSYRVRSDGISSSNSLQQLKTDVYVKKLYRERRKTGTDSYSEKNLKSCMKVSRLDAYRNSLANQFYLNSIAFKKKSKYFLFFINIVTNSIICKYSRKRNLDILIYKIKVRI